MANGNNQQGGGDLLSTAKLLNQNISALVVAIQSVFPRVMGSFIMTAGTTSVVPAADIRANSEVFLAPRNPTAAAIQWYCNQASIVPGTSFTINTVGAAAGTEVFNYFIVTPV